MENKINIAELLKDCPSGMELDCPLYDNVTLGCVLEDNVFPIKTQTPDGQISLNKYGCYSNNKDAKCIIFPKGKTTWEGFVSPCKFKDGDVLVHTQNQRFIMQQTMNLRLVAQTTPSVSKHPLFELSHVILRTLNKKQYFLK
jgi:hypothetical protein